MKTVSLRTGAWYGDKEQTFELPDDATVDILSPNDAPPLAGEEIAEKINRPYGQSLNELAKGKTNILIVTDDLGRPTPSHDIIPHVLAILFQSEIGKENISFLIATGSHRQLTKEELEKKLGTDIVRDYSVESHDAFNSPVIDLGTARNGFPCIVNKKAAKADLIIGIGCVLPHSCHGFGGGAKLFLPGVAGMKSIIAMHGFTPKRGRGKNQTRSTDMRTAAEDFTDKQPPVFLINVVVNTERKICGLFAGSHREVFSAASDLARSVYETPIDEERMKQYNVVIVNAYPLDADPVQSDKVSWVKKYFNHSFKIYINQSTDNIDYHGWKVLRRHSIFNLALLLAGEVISSIKIMFPASTKTKHKLLKYGGNFIISKLLNLSGSDYSSFEINSTFIKRTQTGSNAELPDRSQKPWVYSEHLSFKVFSKKYKRGTLFNIWNQVIKAVNRNFPNATIAVLTCASMQIPVLRKNTGNNS